MNILITGAMGFVGRNLTENLKNIRDGKNRTRPLLKIDEIYEYTRESSMEDLERYCAGCDFVFHLAGVNRPQDPEEFQKINYGLSNVLLNMLKKQHNLCPVMLSSSVQATLTGRFGTSEYGLSKKAGEDLFLNYGRETGAETMIYRFPNLAGKWIKPDYNSAVGTFCHHIANDFPITINDPSVILELLFIDDLLEEMYDALEDHPHRCDYPGEGEILEGFRYDGVTPRWSVNGQYCAAPITYKVSIAQIVTCLREFHNQPRSLLMPSLAPDSFEKKLYSMYLSYLPKEKIAFDLKMNCDERGSFTELLKTTDHGQFSVNISKPGVTKGQHWHNSKWEFFIVVSGHGLIQERRIGSEDVLEFEVSGEKIQAVHMLPGYTHNIINLSSTENLITLMWANETFDPTYPDTFFEPV